MLGGLLPAAGVGVPAILGGTLGGEQQQQQHPEQQQQQQQPEQPQQPYNPDPYRPDPYRQGNAKNNAGRGAFMEPAMAMAVVVSYFLIK